MIIANPQALIDENADVIETFVSSYLMDLGIQVHLFEAIIKGLFTQQSGAVFAPEDVTSSCKEMLGTAIEDLISAPLFAEPVYSLQKVIEGAASLEFLVRYALKVDPAVLPPEVIPSDFVVQAALQLFHQGYQRESLATS